MSDRVSYSRGFPYGAPLVIVRGGATRRVDVKAFLREAGFRWNGASHGYETYLDASDFRGVLTALRDRFECEVVPKAGLDPDYVIDLDPEGVSQ